MNANASSGTKVLPIAKIPIKKTGKFRTRAEATGNSAAGRQPPSRFLNQYKDGAYASEKRRAAIVSEAIVALFTSITFKLALPKNMKASRSVANPINQDAKEMEMSFMSNSRIRESEGRGQKTSCSNNPRNLRKLCSPTPDFKLPNS
jgi:hypothetical protein